MKKILEILVLSLLLSTASFAADTKEKKLMNDYLDDGWDIAKKVDIDEHGLRTYTLEKRNNIVLCHVWLHVFYVTKDQRQPQTLCYKP